MTYQAGDRVEILPHRTFDRDGKIVSQHFGKVIDPHRATDMRRIDGTPVGFYVDVRELPTMYTGGYHEASLVLAERP